MSVIQPSTSLEEVSRKEIRSSHSRSLFLILLSILARCWKSHGVVASGTSRAQSDYVKHGPSDYSMSEYYFNYNSSVPRNRAPPALSAPALSPPHVCPRTFAKGFARAQDAGLMRMARVEVKAGGGLHIRPFFLHPRCFSLVCVDSATGATC